MKYNKNIEELIYSLENFKFQNFEKVTYDLISETTEERTIYKNFRITYKNR